MTTRALFGDWMSDGDLLVDIEVDERTITMFGSGESFAARGWELNSDGFMVLRSAQSGSRFTIRVPDGIESVRLGIGEMDVNHLERLYDFTLFPLIEGRLKIEEESILGRNQNADGVLVWNEFVGDVSFTIELSRGIVQLQYIEIVRLHEQ